MAPHQAIAAGCGTSRPSTSSSRSTISRSVSCGNAVVGMTGASTTSYRSNRSAHAARWTWRSWLARAHDR